MHEVSLMVNVLDTLRENARQNHINKISKVTLIVGKFSMALPSSLKFAFDALSREDILFKDATLQIIEKEIACRCQSCGTKFAIDSHYCFVCPDCGNSNVDLISGRELYIDCYEGE